VLIQRIESVHNWGRRKLTEPLQKYEQTEYPRILDSSAVVLLQLMLPLYWHSENNEYIGGWHTQDAYDRLDVGIHVREHFFVS
jgi:hypothetical protein